MKGYKGFNSKLQCTPDNKIFQYEIGKEYQTEDAECCKTGFHFCENPLAVFNYYPPSDSRYCEVEGDGKIDTREDKVTVSKIKIGMEIGLEGIIEAGVNYILGKVNWKDAKETNTGDWSAATNSGYRSAATNTGDWSAATNTGDQSAATNTGYWSAATNTGDQSAATNSGYRSAATNTGDWSAATNTGDQSAATNTGDQSAAINTGYRSAATNTGDQSAAINTGYRSAATNTGDQSAAINTGEWSAATVEGYESVAVSIGREGKAKGALGCWIVLAEWEYIGKEWHRKDVQCVKVDGEVIKADTYYMLNGGQFVEVE